MSETRYRVLVADPPWKFGDSLPGRGRGAAKQYRTMDVCDIACYPLPPLTSDSVLFLWRVSAMQREALTVAMSWGFTVKAELVWVKLTANGNRWFGMGRTVRGEHETCLIATRGRPRPRSHAVRSTFTAPVGRHSEKPAAFYQIVEQLFAGPYLELFARQRRHGWTCRGLELGSTKR